MLSLKDLFDLVLTAIAFLAFGAFAVQLIMYLMMIPVPWNALLSSTYLVKLIKHFM